MPFDRAVICRQFPWIEHPRPGVILGDDIDGLLSSLLLCDRLDGHIVGFYDYRTVWLGDGHTTEDLANAIWVDLDIYQKHIKSHRR
jgi:hypothetical protein